MKPDVDLASLLPHLLPRAIEWAEARENEILATGVALPEDGIRLAKSVGVAKPDCIRVSIVPTIPLPSDWELQSVALQVGLLGPQTNGLTLGYGIYICQQHVSNRLLSHECRHVHQFEQAGSIRNFLPVYLAQVASVGYYDAPLEVDARAHEIQVM